jgi:hypothetical protein
MAAVRVLEYVDAEGRSPYGTWFDGLNAPAAAKVAAALYQLGRRQPFEREVRRLRRVRAKNRLRSRLPNLFRKGW